MPLLVVPEHVGGVPAGTPPPSQVCSLSVTEPIPGTRMVVLGGGDAVIGGAPITETPSRLVPPGSDDDVPPSEVLLACDLIAVAATVHTPPLGNAQTFCAWVKLDDVLPEVRTWPALSLTEVPVLTSDVDSWSRS